MLTNYANKLGGIKKRINNLLKELDDDSKEFLYGSFINKVYDLEVSFSRLTGSLRAAALEKFSKYFTGDK